MLNPVTFLPPNKPMMCFLSCRLRDRVQDPSTVYLRGGRLATPGYDERIPVDQSKTRLCFRTKRYTPVAIFTVTILRFPPHLHRQTTGRRHKTQTACGNARAFETISRLPVPSQQSAGPRAGLVAHSHTPGFAVV